MSNFKILPTERPNVFTLENENGVWIADVNGRELAEKFAALPLLIRYFNLGETPDLKSSQAAEYWQVRGLLLEMFSK